jgi:hypothetical protein
VNSETPDASAPLNEKLEYRVSDAGTDGALTELPQKLSNVMEFDTLKLEGLPNSKRLTLWFRSGAKRIFYVRMIRSTGRYVVEMGGIKPGEVLRGIEVCRDHLDRFFGISARDIKAYERKSSVKNQPPKEAL